MDNNHPTFQVLAACGSILAVVFVFLLIWVSRYRKVSPDEALIVSGRKIRTPNGTHTGFRIVTAGGTFVFPVIEQAETLSLATFPVELTNIRVRTSDARNVELDCSAQLKVNHDFKSIATAAQNFLHKPKSEIPAIIAPVLEKSLSTAIATTTFNDAERNPAAITTKMETDATGPLTRMGLAIVSLKLKNVRSA